MSMTETISDDANVLYLSIVGGNMVQKVEEGTPGAKRRDWEVWQGEDKKSWTKYEIHHKNLVGIISGMEFVDGNYGEQFILTMTNWEDTAKIHTNASKTSRYFQDFAKKLPNVNIDQEITLNTFDFKTKDGKQLKGMDIKQNWEKITSYYWDGKKSVNGLPLKDKEDDWEDHFKKEFKFLKSEVQKVELSTVNVEQPLEVNEAEDVFE